MTTLSAARRPPSRRRDEAGVSLAIALVILVVITVLGVMAIRRAQLQARLSQNAEATVTARSLASANGVSMVNPQLANQLLSQIAGTSYNVCWMATPSNVSQGANFSCASPNASATLVAFATGLPSTEQPNVYFQVKRDTPSTLPTTVRRDANLSGVAYQFANFSVLSGYDGNVSTSGITNASGVAEVSQSALVPAATVPGLTEQ